MNLTRPTFAVFLISVILAALALLSVVGNVAIPVVSDNTFWTMTAAFGLLVIGVVFKGV